MKRARAGKEGAADRLFRRLLRWAEAALRQRPERDAEDIVPAFVEHLTRDGLAHLPDLDGARFEGYLRVSLAHFLIDWHRREDRHRHAGARGGASGEEDAGPEFDPDSLPGGEPDPLDVVLRRERLQAVRAAIEELPSRDLTRARCDPYNALLCSDA